MLALGVHFVFWTILLIMIELGLFSWVPKLLNCLPHNRFKPKEL